MPNKSIPESVIAYGHRYSRYHTGFDDKASAVREQSRLRKQGKSVIIKKFDWKSGATNKAHFVFYKLYVR